MAAGDGDARLGAEVVGREIHHRRRHAPDVHDVATGAVDAARKRRGKLRPREPAVAPDGDGLLVARARLAPNGLSEALGDLGAERAAHDAADVVGLEDFGRER